MSGGTKWTGMATRTCRRRALVRVFVFAPRLDSIFLISVIRVVTDIQVVGDVPALPLFISQSVSDHQGSNLGWSRRATHKYVKLADLAGHHHLHAPADERKVRIVTRVHAQDRVRWRREPSGA